MAARSSKRSSPPQAPAAAPARRKRSNSSDKKEDEADDVPLEGVLAIGMKNDRRRCFLLGENDFAGFRVESVVFDTGCNTHLLPLPDANSLHQLQKIFPAPWGLSQAAGVSASFYVLTIEQEQGFLVRFSTGILKSSPGIRVPFLRFFLCAEDLATLTAMKILERGAQRVAEQQLKNLDKYPKSRRMHALLGQDFVHGDTAFLQHKNLALLVDKTFDLSWAHLERFRRAVRYYTELLPEGFENLEEVHLGDSKYLGDASEVEYVLIG